MKKLQRLVIVALILSFGAVFFSASAVAQGSSLLFGQKHYYTVVFRGNGEAVTYGRIVVTNPNDRPLEKMTFEIPRATPRELAVFQQQLPLECVEYDYSSVYACVRYAEPDYTSSYYTQGAEYRKVEYAAEGNSYTFTLPKPVEPYKSTALILSFAASGYTSSRFGLYDFEYETLKADSRIEEVRVAVDVDSDLYIKGDRATVDYNSSQATGQEMLDTSASISAESLDSIATSVGYSGKLLKTAKSLSAGESMVVKGEYASNWFRLYLLPITLTVAAAVALLGLLWFLSRFLRKRHGLELSQAAPASRLFSFSRQTAISLVDVTNATAGLVSAGLLAAASYAASRLSYVMYNYGWLDIATTLLGIAITLGFGLAIFGPAAFVGSRRGWRSFVAVLIAEFIWLILGLTIYYLFFANVLPAAGPYPTIQ